jgi:hypothetical protein
MESMMSKPRRGPVSAACLTVGIGLLFVSCDKNRGPTEPTPVPGLRSTGPIAFVSDRDGTEAVYLANAAVDAIGSNRRTLYQSEYGAFGPAWSPDGQRIVFSVGTFVELDPPFGLSTMNADGSGLQHIGVYDGWAPAWSPDGSQIAFISHAGIGIVSPDGSAERLQVAGEIDDVEWTPDGRLIYTRSARGSGGRIFINDGGAERQLIPEATAPLRAAYLDMEVVWRR